MDTVQVPKRAVDLLALIRKDGVIQRASELQEVYRLLAAQRNAMKDHEIARVVNELRDIALQYRDAQQLRERIARVVVPLLAAHSAGAQTDELEALKADNARLLDSLTKESAARCEAEDKLAKTDAARDVNRFAFLITNIKRYQLRESKGFWYYAPIASQDWQRGYRTAREAIDAAIERIERAKEQS